MSQNVPMRVGCLHHSAALRARAGASGPNRPFVTHGCNTAAERRKRFRLDRNSPMTETGRERPYLPVCLSEAAPQVTLEPTSPLRMPSPRERRRRSRQKENRPPGRYISGAVIALAILSLLGAAAVPFLGPFGIPFVASGVVSSVGFAAVWAVLKNLRELNAALNDEYGDAESG